MRQGDSIERLGCRIWGRTVSRLDRFFEISARGSTVATELRGGVVTFIAMAHVIVLNPIIGNQLSFAEVRR